MIFAITDLESPFIGARWQLTKVMMLVSDRPSVEKVSGIMDILRRLNTSGVLHHGVLLLVPTKDEFTMMSDLYDRLENPITDESLITLGAWIISLILMGRAGASYMISHHAKFLTTNQMLLATVVERYHATTIDHDRHQNQRIIKDLLIELNIELIIDQVSFWSKMYSS